MRKERFILRSQPEFQESHFFDHSDLWVAEVFVNLLQEIFVLLVAQITPQWPVPVDPLHLDQKRVPRYL